MAPFTPFLTEEMYQNLVFAVQPEAPRSIHLTDYPEVDASKVAAALDRDMAALLRVTNLGRAARNKASVKVRQPLSTLYVWARSGEVRQAVDALQDQLLDELNVKSLEWVDDPAEYAEYQVKPNFAVLGPKYGKQMNALRAEIMKLDPTTVATAFRAGENVSVTLDGAEARLTDEEVLVDVTEREGFNVAEDGDVLAALDTTLTHELILEGMARDFVRGVQDLRKQAGLQIEDTIRLVYSATGEEAEAIQSHADYIKAETLAAELVPGDAEDCTHHDDVKLGHGVAYVGLTRVGSLLEQR
jgi:isoleucyl-tRNA synthetase